MITNTGKTIISKYMLGQTPAYASYMAIGCGKKPLLSADPYGDYSTQENLDFEMFRVPISSRGFVNEGGINKIVLTAELPHIICNFSNRDYLGTTWWSKWW